MKKRLGFISNSSSSSYIVSIRVDPEDFYNILWSEYSWDLFGKKAIMEKLEKRIKDNGEYSNLPSFHDWNKELKRKIEELQNIDPNDKVKMIKFALDYNGIKIREDDDEVELEYFTSMHNDFNEGVNDLLKEIILFFLMDTQYKVKARRDGE